jgi:multiple RNA-binding domain-containing protein 1
MDTSRLFVRNLAFTCSKEELQELFSPFGTVTDVHIPLSRDSKFPKGLAYITFSTPQEAIAAYERLDGTTFQGRLVHILPCKKATPTSAVLDKGSKKVLESQKKKLKVQVSNPLYMQEQTIVSSIAAHLAVGKQNVLNADHESSGNLAVKLAISEASLQASLITYLERAGINLRALFNDGRTRKKKSDTILVCKNVVPGVTEEELVRLLTRHGRLSRLVFPPHSTLAVCEFLDPVDAKRAYTHLLGSNLRSQPLLLEFAPEDTFALSHDPPSQEPLVKVPNHTNANEGANQDDTEYKVEGMSSRTLFVKNISFRTTEQGLKDFFTGKDLAVKSVKIPQSKLSNAKRSSSHHAGFGFVEFASEQQCKLALDKLQDAQLDGHQLSLSVSCQNTVAAANSSQGPKAIDKALNAVAKEPPSDQAFRLLVKNVPFEATAEDVRDLFRAFVRVKRVKLPRKLLGKQHRGFAFVDCATPREAIEAMRTLSRAHLYGRHLVLEWAADQGTAATLASHPMHGQDLDDNNNVVDHNSHGDGESDLQIYDE